MSGGTRVLVTGAGGFIGHHPVAAAYAEAALDSTHDPSAARKVHSGSNLMLSSAESFTQAIAVNC